MDKQTLELLLEQGLSVERIAKRFGKHPSTVSYWMKKHGLVSPYRDKHAAKGGIEREIIEQLVAAGSRWPRSRPRSCEAKEPFGIGCGDMGYGRAARAAHESR